MGNSKDKTATLSWLEFLGLLAAMVISVGVTGFVVAALWGWFFSPLGLRGVTVLHGAGIALTVRMFVGSNATTNSKLTGTWFIKQLLTALVVLGVGWTIHRFM